MNPLNDPVVFTLVIAFGLAAGWLLITFLSSSSTGFRRWIRKVKCSAGFHAPSGHFLPAIGARDVMRCLYCDQIVYEVKRSKESLRREK